MKRLDAPEALGRRQQIETPEPKADDRMPPDADAPRRKAIDLADWQDASTAVISA